MGTLYFPKHFSVNLELALKNKSIKKIRVQIVRGKKWGREERKKKEEETSWRLKIRAKRNLRKKRLKIENAYMRKSTTKK